MTSKLSRSPLATNIVNLRKARKWSQAELAHRVGVHLNTIKSIETDQNEGSGETRQAIAQALGVTLAELYQDEKTKEATPHPFAPDWKEAARILNAIAACPPHRRLAALFLLTKDESYLDELRALPHGAQFALMLKKAT